MTSFEAVAAPTAAPGPTTCQVALPALQLRYDKGAVVAQQVLDPALTYTYTNTGTLAPQLTISGQGLLGGTVDTPGTYAYNISGVAGACTYTRAVTVNVDGLCPNIPTYTEAQYLASVDQWFGECTAAMNALADNNIAQDKYDLFWLIDPLLNLYEVTGDKKHWDRAWALIQRTQASVVAQPGGYFGWLDAAATAPKPSLYLNELQIATTYAKANWMAGVDKWGNITGAETAQARTLALWVDKNIIEKWWDFNFPPPVGSNWRNSHTSRANGVAAGTSSWRDKMTLAMAMGMYHDQSYLRLGITTPTTTQGLPTIIANTFLATYPTGAAGQQLWDTDAARAATLGAAAGEPQVQDTGHAEREAEFFPELAARGWIADNRGGAFAVTFADLIWNQGCEIVGAPAEDNGVFFSNYIDGNKGIYQGLTFTGTGGPYVHGMNSFVPNGWLRTGRYNKKAHQAGIALYHLLATNTTTGAPVNSVHQRNRTCQRRIATAANLVVNLRTKVWT